MKYNFDNIDINGPDGNAICLMATVSTWLSNEHADERVINDFIAEAKKSNYQHVLDICRKYADIASNMAYDNGWTD